MRCKNCGSEVSFENGSAICLVCGSRYEYDKAFENVDVFICYKETDDEGRRTKDSLLAQEIYYKLESARVNTFYERISASNLTDENLEKAYYTALHNASILIVLGTKKEYFDELLQREGKNFSEKKIFPVVAGADVTDIPAELRKLQALNYDSVGASSDLVNNILTQLGRKEEINIITTGDRTRRRRKIVAISMVLSFLALILGGASYYVFGTPYVLKENKYAYAQELIEEEQYMEAIGILCELGDYENSKNLLSSLYARYEGYYWNEHNHLSLHVNISTDYRMDVEVAGNIQDIALKITESSVVNENQATMEFIDSENNAGSLTLTLTKETLILHISTETKSEVSFGEKTIEFPLAEKSDKPFSKTVDMKILLEWLDNKVTINDISRMGFELEHNGNLFEEANRADAGTAYAYKIKNTDITLAAFANDLSLDDFYSEKQDFYDEKENNLIVFLVTAPANLVLPEKVGKEAIPFESEGYLYVPEGEMLSYPGAILEVCQPLEFDTRSLIEKNTMVTFASRKSISKTLWETLLESSVGEYYSKKITKMEETDNGGIYDSIHVSAISQSKEKYLIMASRNVLEGNLTKRSLIAYYTVNKGNGDIQMILEYAIVTEYEQRFTSYPGIDKYPELFEEFMNGLE